MRAFTQTRLHASGKSGRPAQLRMGRPEVALPWLVGWRCISRTKRSKNGECSGAIGGRKKSENEMEPAEESDINPAEDGPGGRAPCPAIAAAPADGQSERAFTQTQLHAL